MHIYVFDDGVIAPAQMLRGREVVGFYIGGGVIPNVDNDGGKEGIPTFGVWDLTLPARASEP